MVRRPDVSSVSSAGAAVIVPVGPSDEDVTRLADLLRSIERYEPAIRAVVLIDDAGTPRDLRAIDSGTMRLVAVQNPRRGSGDGRWGGLAAGVLHALQWIDEQLDVSWVVKMDVDALAIAPFAEAITGFLNAHPDAGVIGCVGETSDRAEPLFRSCLRRRSRFVLACNAIGHIAPERFEGEALVPVNVPHLNGPIAFSASDYRAFTHVRPHIELAIAHGLEAAEYCQGGAYVIAGETIRRMSAMGFLTSTWAWPSLPFGEDETVSMYCRAVNLRVHDFSNAGEPFGVRYRGLPCSPAELIARGHSLIHSINSARHGSEADIRHFFAARRGSRASI
jgi:hypothetical protein